jgi:NAD(P)-dependent dehydrogenase (short-subunit alcohol dehydrogenase family)
VTTEPRVAVVTGGTRGIGRACTSVLARDGFEVVFCGRDQAPGAEVEREVSGARFVQADVCDPADVTRMIEVATEIGGGRIAALVNNAGQVVDRAFGDLSSEEWDQMIEANSRSVFLTTQGALDALIGGRGAVVTISSIAGAWGWRGLAAYAASKASLIALTSTLAMELGDRVRFNCICPGEIATRLMEEELRDPVERAKIERRIPAARFGAPEEIAEVAAFLLSERASYVNGVAIPVDGGETAGFGPPSRAT